MVSVVLAMACACDADRADFSRTAQAAPAPAAKADALPSWNDGASKKAIVDFVRRVTTKGSRDFVPEDERIATFDNDGTLWAEKPMYVEAVFALDRVKALAPQHPEWKRKQPFQGVLEGDREAVAATGKHGLMEIIGATHAGTTPDQFDRLVEAWLGKARHPRFDRPYTDLVYQPMLELLAYLRDRGFKTFIVSGGGAEFMRPWVGSAYGVAREQTVGSRAKTQYAVRGGKPALLRLPEVDFVDDGAGKPVGIQELIGRRPIAAFGNSDGDYEMLDWTTSGKGARLGLIVHHTDAEREWAYDRDSKIGRLSRALDAAPEHGWVVADMKRDWRVVFPFEKAPKRPAP